MRSTRTLSPLGDAAPSPTKYRRRPPASPAEQQRRRAWGKEWGEVTAAHSRQMRAKEGK